MMGEILTSVHEGRESSAKGRREGKGDNDRLRENVRGREGRKERNVKDVE